MSSSRSLFSWLSSEVLHEHDAASTGGTLPADGGLVVRDFTCGSHTASTRSNQQPQTLNITVKLPFPVLLPTAVLSVRPSLTLVTLA